MFRNEDLDPQRCRAEFVQAMFEDLRWLGIEWQEGPDCGGPVRPIPAERTAGRYLEAWRTCAMRGRSIHAPVRARI